MFSLACPTLHVDSKNRPPRSDSLLLLWPCSCMVVMPRPNALACHSGSMLELGIVADDGPSPTRTVGHTSNPRISVLPIQWLGILARSLSSSVLVAVACDLQTQWGSECRRILAITPLLSLPCTRRSVEWTASENLVSVAQADSLDNFAVRWMRFLAHHAKATRSVRLSLSGLSTVLPGWRSWGWNDDSSLSVPGMIAAALWSLASGQSWLFRLYGRLVATYYLRFRIQETRHVCSRLSTSLVVRLDSRHVVSWIVRVRLEVVCSSR